MARSCRNELSPTGTPPPDPSPTRVGERRLVRASGEPLAQTFKLTAFDYAVLLILAVSVLLSVMRGFVREVLALAAWLIAFVAASASSTSKLSASPRRANGWMSR